MGSNPESENQMKKVTLKHKNFRKSSIRILFRIWFIFTFPAPLIALFLNELQIEPAITATKVWGGFIATCMLWSFPIASILMRLLGPFFWNDNWHYFRQSGGRPLLDAIPTCLSGQSMGVRLGGLPEPNYKWYHHTNGFEPPPSWEYQCRSCGSFMEHGDEPCWFCSASDYCEGDPKYAKYRHLYTPMNRAMGDKDFYYVEDDEPQQQAQQTQPEKPTVYDDKNGEPYCLDENDRPYWWDRQGNVVYLAYLENDPNFVPMSK
jgi:hypothetical protein